MQAWIEGVHYYINDEGWVVLTEQFHLDRGYCCGNGCKHCPYHFENVPEPKRTELLKQERGNQDAMQTTEPE